MNVDNFVKALREYRLEHGLTYEQLAEKVDLQIGTVHQIIAGQQKPRELTMYAIKKALPDLVVPDDSDGDRCADCDPLSKLG